MDKKTASALAEWLAITNEGLFRHPRREGIVYCCRDNPQGCRYLGPCESIERFCEDRGINVKEFFRLAVINRGVLRSV